MAKKKKGKTTVQKRTVKTNIKRKKKRVKIGRIIFTIVLLCSLVYAFFHFVSFPIKNIYVKGNSIFTDQEIIELAKISSYPSIFEYSSRKIERTLKQNTYILDAHVEKKYFKEIHITIEENRPLFYNRSKEKTILSDKTEVSGELEVPVLINYVPDTLYDKFIDKINSIDEKIYSKVSEIKYDPNKVDDKRFLLTMSDGNYVYLTLNKFEKINNYVEIMQKVLAKYKEDKGILYLDEGEYFKKID